MIIEIPSEGDLSDTTIISGFPIEEEIESPEVQKPQLQTNLDPMARKRKEHE